MISKAPPRFGGAPIFYGWWIVITVSLVIAVAWACSLWALPVFYTFWLNEFSWDRAAVTGAGGAVLLFTSACYPFAGAIMDRLGVKRVMILCIVLMGAALFGYASLSGLWQLYFFSAVLGVGLAGTGIMTDQVLISKWFVKKRGLAVGITMAGIGVGASLGPQVGLFLSNTFGWRQAFIIQGLFVWLVALPLFALIIKETPHDIGLLPDGELKGGGEGEKAAATESTEGLSFVEALRSPTLWLLSGASFLSFLAVFALTNHLILYLKDSGYTLEKASWALSVYGFFSFLGKILFGRLLDASRSKRSVILATYVLLGVGLLILVGLPRLPILLYVSVCCMGLAWGGSLVCMTGLTASYFGMKNLGSILGFVMVFFGLSGAVGPPLVGYIYDQHQSYYWAFRLLVLCVVGAAAAALLLRPPRAETGIS